MVGWAASGGLCRWHELARAIEIDPQGACWSGRGPCRGAVAAEVKAMARTLGLEVVPLEIQRAEDIAPAFEALEAKADAMYVVVDALIAANRTRIITPALSARLPTI